MPAEVNKNLSRNRTIRLNTGSNETYTGIYPEPVSSTRKTDLLITYVIIIF
jgi:hypothetical protein